MDIRATQTLNGSDADTRAPGSNVRILHITDTHIFGSAARTLLGVDTLQSMRRVIALAKHNAVRFDLALATGDLVHDASAAGYRLLTNELAALDTPVYCIPGNHDERIAMSRYLGNETVVWGRDIGAGGWRILMLDSVIPNQNGGRLEEKELEFLANSLAADPRSTLICLHHHPQPVAMQVVADRQRPVANAAEFFTVIGRHDHVKGILFGHIHQDYDQLRGKVRLIASPSTCVQFVPRSVDFRVDHKAPGYRVLELLSDGGIQTRVVRCAQMPSGLEMASAGY